MKKMIAVILTVLMVLSVGMLFVSADEAAQSADVFVSIGDKDGKLAAAAEKVAVTDRDGDEALTINDALIAAHDKFYDGGAAAGYATESTKYGLSMVKLWGYENGYNYSYLVNNELAWNLTDPVQEGDYVAAYTFTDTKFFSDTYTYFDKVYIEEKSNIARLELTLKKITFDDQGMAVHSPVAGAKITKDGDEILTTNQDGKASFVVDCEGSDEQTVMMSAKVADLLIVPPVCRIVLNKQEEATPDEAEPTAATTPIIDDGGDEDTTAPTAAVTEAPSEGGSTKDESTKDESTGDQSTNDSSSTPKTGDVTKMWLWVLIGAVCLAGIIGAVVFYKKRYGNK